MNKIYRLIFNIKRGQLVAVAEISTGKGKSNNIGDAPVSGIASLRPCLDLSQLVCLGMSIIFSATPSWAGTLPAGGAVSVGSGTITTSGNTMTVQQDSQKLGINWQSFNIGASDKVTFNQPGASSVALNRIYGGSRSEIYGNLTANGQVFLVNPNGVLFGKTAEVNVGGLLATSKNISDDDFTAGNYRFSGSGGGEVVNQGNLKAVNGGFIVLAANEVKNEGTISATGGNAVLAAGATISLDLDNSNQVKVTVDGVTLRALIDNQGLIEADGGSVVLTARGKEMLQDSAINLKGIIRARSIGEKEGNIIIDGGSVVAENASVDASGLNVGGSGGKITVTGENINLTDSTSIDARGNSGGGTVLIGGDYQGQGDLPHAKTLAMDSTAKIDASATGNGQGGKVVLWSDERTDFSGTINAMGGPAGGDGGLVETSSHGNLQAFGRVRAEAPLGKAGTWLLDPENVTFVESNTPPEENTQNHTSDSQVSTESVNSQAGAGTTVVIQTATGTTQITADTPAVSSDGSGAGINSCNEIAKDQTPATPIEEGASVPGSTGTDTTSAPAATSTAVNDALPSGGSVFTGSGSISTDGTTMTVQQNSEKLGLNWQNFNIGTNNSVVFNQPGATSIALNRVLGGSRSEIYGKLKANGQVFLYNPNGVLFGPTAEVSVGSLSTRDIADSDFTVGTYTAPTTGNEVVNQGNITAESGGSIELTGDRVENEGTISATGGSVALTSIAPATESAGISAAITDATARGGFVQNKGLIEADGGRIAITAVSSDPKQENGINIDGILRARSIGEQSGSIVISGVGGEVAFTNAKVDITGLGNGEHGGEVTVSGKDVSILGNSEIDARGDTSGGSVLIGGDYQGQGILPHAETVIMSENAAIDASAVQTGDGGKVVLWSDVRTEFAGNIAAKGGTQSGNGGMVETSGKMLQVGESALVSTRAENGQTGNWLLDPNNYTIAAAGGNISGSTLSSSLGSSNVTIRTSTMGTAGGNGDIFVNDAVSWSSIYRLTLEAERNVAITRAINASNSNSSFYVQAPELLTISGTGSARAGNVNYSIGDANFSGSTTSTGTRLFIGSHGPRQLRIESSATAGALSLTPTELATLHAQNSGDLNLSGDGLIISTALSSSRVDAEHFSLHSRADIDVNATIDLSPSSTALHFITDDNVHLNSSIKAQGITLEGRTSQASSATLTADWLQISGNGAVLDHASVGSLRGNATGTIWVNNGSKSLSVDGSGVTAGNVGIYTNDTLTLNAPVRATGSGAVSLGATTWTDPLCTGACERPFIDINAYKFTNNYGASALRTQPGEFWSIHTNDPALTTLGGISPYVASYNAPIPTGNILLSSNRVFYRQPDPGGPAPSPSPPLPETPTPVTPAPETTPPNNYQDIAYWSFNNIDNIKKDINDSNPNASVLLFEAIKAQYIVNNPNDIVWYELYTIDSQGNHIASDIERSANTMAQAWEKFGLMSADDLFLATMRGDITPSSSDLSWQALYSYDAQGNKESASDIQKEVNQMRNIYFNIEAELKGVSDSEVDLKLVSLSNKYKINQDSKIYQYIQTLYGDQSTRQLTVEKGAVIDIARIIVPGRSSVVQITARSNAGDVSSGPYQCTALVSAYTSNLSGSNDQNSDKVTLIGNGKDTARNLDGKSFGTTKFTYQSLSENAVERDNFIPGSVLSFDDGGGFGHTAIAENVSFSPDGNTVSVRLIEQNMSSTNAYEINRTVTLTKSADGTWLYSTDKFADYKLTGWAYPEKHI